MTGLLVIVGAVYGLSALAMAGGGVAWLCSGDFRRSIMGDQHI